MPLSFDQAGEALLMAARTGFDPRALATPYRWLV